LLTAGFSRTLATYDLQSQYSTKGRLHYRISLQNRIEIQITFLYSLMT
jgi:hypothetical protein